MAPAAACTGRIRNGRRQNGGQNLVDCFGALIQDRHGAPCAVFVGSLATDRRNVESLMRLSACGQLTAQGQNRWGSAEGGLCRFVGCGE